MLDYTPVGRYNLFKIKIKHFLMEVPHMYKVIVKHQTPDYKWNMITIHPFINWDEADRMHEKQSHIARELMAENKIIDYQIETFKAD